MLRTSVRGLPRVLPQLAKMSAAPAATAAHVHSVAASGFGEGTNDLVSMRVLHTSTHARLLLL